MNTMWLRSSKQSIAVPLKSYKTDVKALMCSEDDASQEHCIEDALKLEGHTRASSFDWDNFMS